jgi:EAL domain-containing protein (putative c-di-GMP-specific phosphodiesterase class I)/DNA-binding NarL/FixJ family response regulator
MSSIGVLIADDEPVVRRALASLIGAYPSLELLGVASDATEAIRLARRHRPDVAVLDVKMPGGGSRAARRIIASSPRTRVVALSAYADRETVLEMIKAGASGYVVKGSPGGQIVETIMRCANGESMLSVEITGEVMAELSHHLELEERELVARRAQIERIRRVLDDGLLAPVFQPIVDLRSGDLVGVEALARLPADLPGPEAWFAAAESVGLRVELEVHAARVALGQLASIPARSFLAVNLSPNAIGAVLCSDLIELEHHGRLVLEVTEHARVDDYSELGAVLTRVRADGLRVAVDDVGAGFASLRHILNLAPEFIKLDISLTRDIHVRKECVALARALIALADELGAAIVAEGIETEEQLDALRGLGVSYGQGYYLAHPGPLPTVLNSVGPIAGDARLG